MRIQQKTMLVTQEESGSKNQGWNISEPYGPITRTFEVPTVRIETESFSSRAHVRTVKILVPFKPKFSRPVTPPTMPVLHYPLRPRFGPQRPNQSKRSYLRAKERFRAKLENWTKRVKDKEASHERRLAKYQHRMKLYEAYQRKLIYGVPKNHRVIAMSAKDLPWNPYSRRITVSLPLRGDYSSKTNVFVWSPPGWIQETQVIKGYMENYFVPPSWSPPGLSDKVAKVLSATDSRATRKIHDKIGEQSVHIGNILAERQQTIDMIGGLIRSLFRAVRSFSVRYLIKETVELLSFHRNKVLANRLLEFLFGVKPLMNDIYAAVEALKRKESDTFVELKARATLNDTFTFEEVHEDSNSGGFYKQVDKYTVSVRVKVSYVLHYAVDSQFTSALQRLGLINPAEILWEKIPWSFVVDWVLPIGGWIRSFTSDTGLSFVRGSKTTTVEIISQLSRTYQGSSTSTWQNTAANGSWTGLNTVITKERKLLSETPEYNFPTFKNPISWTHIVESLALLRQKL